MPAKKTKLSDDERAQRIRKVAREIGTSSDPEAFEKAFNDFAKRAKPMPDKAKLQKTLVRARQAEE